MGLFFSNIKATFTVLMVICDPRDVFTFVNIRELVKSFVGMFINVSFIAMVMGSMSEVGPLFLNDQKKQKQDIFKAILNQYFLYRKSMLLYFTKKIHDQHPWWCLFLVKLLIIDLQFY